MKAQDKKQDDALLAVQKLLQEVLENDVVDHLKSEVEAQIAAVIDKEVEEQVKLQLDYHLSQTLQDEIENYRRQIETAQRDLVNSESRRANSVLEKPKDLVHPVYGPNGEVSKKYPKDLQALFNIDGNTAKELVIEYQIGAVSTSRNVNLNMFMRHIGVAFQLMSAGPDQPSIPVKINRHNGIVAAL
ncbi:hypothetical protein JAAARDRAFT_546849 [Jaapia argillacea MUCL 33604]|uniref:Uncharacterized protein n=1 Tax=Jaapia argillacea MUCL 33604 TaxID=933084 RepID=A0A067P821_9AGAM|nr:hypothetical protein JAAARDRAFT_546849 [Jaapia argillacea MUCL 33604]